MHLCSWHINDDDDDELMMMMMMMIIVSICLYFYFYILKLRLEHTYRGLITVVIIYCFMAMHHFYSCIYVCYVLLNSTYLLTLLTYS